MRALTQSSKGATEMATKRAARKADKMGLDRDGARVLLVNHTFDRDADGNVTHSIDGTKRAEIMAENWPDYCAQVPEAAAFDAQG